MKQMKKLMMSAILAAGMLSGCGSSTGEEMPKVSVAQIMAHKSLDTIRDSFDAEMKELLFAWKVVKQTKSNAIVLAKDQATVGVGPGQTNRVTALDLAIRYAGDKTNGSVMASDAFFPFSDCVELAAKHGITAIIQPGGSIRDEDSIKAADEAGIAMVFTGVRHFKH